MVRYNVYCDESCHLENDDSNVMALGAIWLPKDRTRETSKAITLIKQKHGFSKFFEIKWTKVSDKRIDFYFDILKYFFDNQFINYRGLVITQKNELDHARFDQTHDDWYYKMYFTMLKTILSSEDRFRILIDKKDTLGFERIEKLHEVLSNNMYDFNRQIIEDVKIVVSHESNCLQLADLLTGAICYSNRGLSSNPGKVKIVEKIKELSSKSLDKNTLLRDLKFNLLLWEKSNHV